MVDPNENPSFQDNSETQARVLFVKKLPQLSIVLRKVEGMFNTDGLPEIFFEASRGLSIPYLGWLEVRNERAQEIIGRSPIITGFEGHFAHLKKLKDPAAIIEAEAKIGQEALDLYVIRNPFSSRQAINELLYQGSITSPKSLEPLDKIFRYLLNSARHLAYTSSDPDAVNTNAQFKRETQLLVSGLPPLSYGYEGNTLVHAYSLAKSPKSIHTVGPQESDIPRKYELAMRLMRTIGIIGHPLARIMYNPIVAAMANRTFYPPFGTDARSELDAQALLHMIKYLGQKG